MIFYFFRLHFDNSLTFTIYFLSFYLFLQPIISMIKFMHSGSQTIWHGNGFFLDLSSFIYDIEFRSIFQFTLIPQYSMTNRNNISPKLLLLPYSHYQANNFSLIGFKIDTYHVLKKIGQGSFGSIYLSMQQKTNNLLVIKSIDMKMIQSQDNLDIQEVKKRVIEREAYMMAKCYSQNLVKIIDIFENNFFKLLLMEFCHGGNLANKVTSKGNLKEIEAVTVLKQILNGLFQLHENGIIHRDLKPQNILINDQVYKIGDFGFSRQLQQNDCQKEINQTNLGTLCTMAPEVIEKKQYGLKADIWSIGVIFYYILYGKYPFEGRQRKQLLQEMRNRDIFDPNNVSTDIRISQKAKSFIQQCLKINSKQRLNWQRIKSHELFTSQTSEKLLLFNCHMEQRTQDSMDEKTIKIKIVQSQKEDNRDIYNKIEESQTKLINAQMMGKKQFQTKKYELKNILKNKEVSWTKLVNFQFLRAEFILKQILQPFQLCPKSIISNRNVIQTLFLVTCRCFEDISQKKSQTSLKKDKTVLNFSKMIDTLHNRLYERLRKYSERLLNKENQTIDIIKSKMLCFFKYKEQKQKQMYFARIRTNMQVKFTPAYTKSQQVNFTQKMINQCIQMISREQSIPERTVNLMRNFDKICGLSFKDVGDTYFRSYVTNLYQKH